MYADDMVLMSTDPHELAAMLKIMDKVAAEYGLTINAAKTEIQIQRPAKCTDHTTMPTVHLSSGDVKATKEFKYLGGWTQEDWGMDKEIAARRMRALGVFQSFDKVWANKKLQLHHKMSVYNAFILPHFLYGAETWNCTATQLRALEVAHSTCLRRILGVGPTGCHALTHIRSACGSQPLELMIIKRTFQWLGHVMRMQSDRYPAKVFGCVPAEGKRAPGRPKATYRHTYISMLQKLNGVVDPREWLKRMHEDAQDRVSWRAMVKGFTFVDPNTKASQRTRPYLGRSCKRGAATGQRV
jgi:hypothetical protein